MSFAVAYRLKKALRSVYAALGLVLAVLSLSPATASAQPISCGEVLAEDVTFEADLSDCPGTALVIGADGITVDLNGHTVSSACAIECAERAVIDNRGGYDRVRILNGTVRSGVGVRVGVALAGAERNALKRLTLSREPGGPGYPGIALSLLNSSRNSIDESTFRGGDPAILLSDSERNSISRSLISGGISIHVGDAIRIIDSDKNKLVDSRVEADGGGVIIQNSIRNRIARNDVGSYYGSIELGNADRTLISNNTVSAGPPGTTGIDIGSGSDENVIRSNEASRAPLRIQGDRNQVEHNDVSSEMITAIDVASGEANLVRNNTATGGYDGDAIAVRSAATDTRVQGNFGTGAIDDGIDVDAPGTLIRGNTATDNYDLGIEAVAGVIDGGANRASGNGNPLQCLNIICR